VIGVQKGTVSRDHLRYAALLWRGEAEDDARGLDELAGLVQLSRFHFRASFSLATGMTRLNG